MTERLKVRAPPTPQHADAVVLHPGSHFLPQNRAPDIPDRQRLWRRLHLRHPVIDLLPRLLHLEEDLLRTDHGLWSGQRGLSVLGLKNMGPR